MGPSCCVAAFAPEVFEFCFGVILRIKFAQGFATIFTVNAPGEQVLRPQELHLVFAGFDLAQQSVQIQLKPHFRSRIALNRSKTFITSKGRSVSSLIASFAPLRQSLTSCSSVDTFSQKLINLLAKSIHKIATNILANNLLPSSPTSLLTSSFSFNTFRWGAGPPLLYGYPHHR